MSWYNPVSWFAAQRPEPKTHEIARAKTLAADLTHTLPEGIVRAQDAGVLPKLPASASMQIKGLVTELPPLPVGLFDSIPEIKAALAAHSLGNLQASGQLAISLLQDARIAGPLQVRCGGVANLPIAMRPGNPDSPLAVEIARYCQANFATWFPVPEQIRHDRTLLLLGASLAQIIWKPPHPVPGWQLPVQDPEVNCWGASNSREFCYWDGTLPNGHNYGRWLIAYATGVGEPIEGDGQWLFSTLTAKSAWNEGLVLGLGYLYASRMSALRRRGQFVDRYANPYFVVRPAVGLDEASQAELANTLSRSPGPFLVLPSGEAGNQSDAKWEGITSQAYQIFDSSRDKDAQDCAILILGQPSTTDSAPGGTHAGSKLHESVRQTFIELDATRKARDYREQLLKPFVALNFANKDAALVEELTPWLEYQTDPPESKSQRGQALGQLAAFLEGPNGVPPNVDVDALLAQFEVPLKTTEEATEQ